MPNPIGLTPAQLIEVTGRRRASKQIEALALMHIPFKIRFDGTPFVTVESLTPVSQQGSVPEAVLNLNT